MATLDCIYENMDQTISRTEISDCSYRSEVRPLIALTEYINDKHVRGRT